MKNLYFLLISTFVMGVISGVYIFFASQSESPVFWNPGTEVRGFEITGDVYGGCERVGCPSFRILDTGSYIYLRSVEGGDDIRHELKLNDNELKNIKNELRTVPLSEIEESSKGGTCAIAADGVAYKYRVTLGEDEYVIDSCENDIEGTKLFDLLEDYFDEPN